MYWSVHIAGVIAMAIGVAVRRPAWFYVAVAASAPFGLYLLLVPRFLFNVIGLLLLALPLGAGIAVGRSHRLVPPLLLIGHMAATGYLGLTVLLQ